MKTFSKVIGILLLLFLIVTTLFGLVLGGILVASGTSIANGTSGSSNGAVMEGLARALGGTTFLVIGIMFLAIGLISVICFGMILAMNIRRAKGKNTLISDWIVAIFNVGVFILAIVLVAKDKEVLVVSVVMMVLALMCELFVLPDMISGMSKKKKPQAVTAARQAEFVVEPDIDDVNDDDGIEYEPIIKG